MVDNSDLLAWYEPDVQLFPVFNCSVTFNVISVQLDSEAVSAIAPSSGFQTNGFIYLGYLNLTVPDNQMYARIGYSGCMTNVSVRNRHIHGIEVLTTVKANMYWPLIWVPLPELSFEHVLTFEQLQAFRAHLTSSQRILEFICAM